MNKKLFNPNSLFKMETEILSENFDVSTALEWCHENYQI